jgi:hypothetical protein
MPRGFRHGEYGGNKMNDAAFRNELWIACYKRQIDGYPFGHPRRTNFQPIVPSVGSREGTLEAPCYASYFTDKEKAELLDEGNG